MISLRCLTVASLIIYNPLREDYDLIPIFLKKVLSRMWHEMDFTSVAAKLVVASIVLLLLGRLLEPSTVKQEPPLVRAKLPLFGHLIGLLRHGNAYFHQTS